MTRGRLAVSALLAISVACVGVAQETPRNLLPRGDFETRGEKGQPDGWTLEDWGGYSEAHAEIVGGARVGKGCLQVRANAPFVDYACSSDAVAIPRGQPLLLTAWYRTDKTPRAQLMLATFREGFAQTRWATPTVLVRSAPLLNSRDWRAVALRIEPCDVAREAVALMRLGGEGTLRIDDVRLSVFPRSCTLQIESAGDVMKLPDARLARVRVTGTPPARAVLVIVAEWGDGRAARQTVPLAKGSADDGVIEVPYKCPAQEPHRIQALLLTQEEWAILAEAGRHCPALMTPRFTLPACRPYLFSTSAVEQAQITVDIAAGEPLRRDLSLEAVLRRARALDGRDEEGAGRQIERAGIRAPLGATIALSLPTRDLAEGAYEAAVQLKRGQQVLQEVCLPLSKLGARPWEVSFDGRGNLIADGLPFFPIAIHDVDTPEALDAVSDAGFNTAIVPTAYASTAFADRAQELGLKVVVQAESADQDRWLRLVAKFGSHPALLGWATMESPDEVPVPTDVAQDLHEFVAQTDPYHPILSALASVDGFWEYQSALDIVGVDRYPLPYLDLGTLADDIAAARAASRGDKPVWAGIQACPRPGVPAEAGERLPLPAEYRCLAYLAVVSGAQGLGTLVYHMPKVGNAPAFTLPQDAPELWAEARKLNAEVRFWMPALVAPDAPQQPRVEGDGVRALLKREARQLVLFAVNRGSLPTSAVFTMPGLGRATARVPLENRELQAGDGGELRDDFAPYGVHVYVLPLPAA